MVFKTYSKKVGHDDRKDSDHSLILERVNGDVDEMSSKSLVQGIPPATWWPHSSDQHNVTQVNLRSVFQIIPENMQSLNVHHQ